MAPTLPPKGPHPDEGAPIGPEGDTTMLAAARVYQLTPAIHEDASAARTPASPGHRSMSELAGDWLAAKAQSEAEFLRLNAAERAARALHPEIPAAIRDFRQAFYPASDAELQQRDETHRSSTWPRTAESPHLDAKRRWEAQCDAIDSSFGVRSLDEAADRAARSMTSIADAIISMRPTTAAEAAIKYGVLLETYKDADGGIDDPRPFFGFLADLEAVAAGAR